MIKTLVSASILFLTCFLTLPVSASNDAESDLNSCNQIHMDARYEAAIDCYQRLTGDQLSPEILYNIGNSYAMKGDSGRSILFYLRALHLSPSDADIISNLSFVRDQAGIFPPERTPVELLFQRFTVAQWSMLCLLSVFIYLLYSVTRFKSPAKPVTEISMIFLCLSLLILGVSGARFRAQELKQSVVLADSRLLLSPFDTSESVGSIQAGRLVTPSKTHDSYIFVTDSTRRSGWIHGDSMEPVINR